jgi:hypothetical protein
MKIGPRYKKARYLGAPVFRKTQTQKYAMRLQRKSKTMGGRRGAKSEYGKQMLENQKLPSTLRFEMPLWNCDVFQIFLGSAIVFLYETASWNFSLIRS